MIPAALMYPALVQFVDEEHLLLRVLDASPPALQRFSSVAGRAARATSSVAGRSLCTRHSTPPAALDAGAISAVVCEHLLTRHCTQSPATARWPSTTYGIDWDANVIGCALWDRSRGAAASGAAASGSSARATPCRQTVHGGSRAAARCEERGRERSRLCGDRGLREHFREHFRSTSTPATVEYQT
jgi:hypothetical protein